LKNFNLLFLLISSLYLSQTKKIFFKSENDSIISIVDQDGKVIVEPFVSFYSSGVHDKEIKDEIIFIGSIKNSHYVDRQGKFLFYPYYFDNGPDYHKEAAFRFTSKEGKVGLSDLQGNILIPAKYDFISQLNFGYLYYCQGCYFDREKDPEHPQLVNTKISGYLDRNGKEIKTTDHRNHLKDTKESDGKFVPYQFSYTEFEKNILKKLEKKLIKINKINISEGEKLTFEIITRPTKNNPYYFVKLYRFQKDSDFSTDNDDAAGFNFYIDQNANIFVPGYAEEDENFEKILIPFDEWIKKSN